MGTSQLPPGTLALGSEGIKKGTFASFYQFGAILTNLLHLSYSYF